MFELIHMLKGLRPGMSLTEFEEEVAPWLSSKARYRRHRSSGGGGAGGGGGIQSWLVGIVVVIFVVYLVLNLVADFSPQIGNLTYSGGGLGATFFDLAKEWFLPIVLVGVIVYLIIAVIGHKKII